MTSGSASRVTHSSRSLRRALVLSGCCLVAATVLRAQEPAAEKGQATEGSERTDETAVQAPAAAADEEKESATGQGRERGVVGSTPGRFEPTEKVRADFDVSFPVDI